MPRYYSTKKYTRGTIFKKITIYSDTNNLASHV